MLKRDWKWHSGSGEQKERYIKNLERIIALQDKRLSLLEQYVVKGGN